MKSTIQSKTGFFALGLVLAFCFSAGAQQTKQPDLRRMQFYDLSREGSLIGTVVKYETASNLPPIGAHVLVQTASGPVDVHLGNAKLLKANHFELNPGDSVRIIGEDLAFGDSTIFAARIVQKGMQAVAVRNARGFLLSPASTMSPAQIEALRGVR